MKDKDSTLDSLLRLLPLLAASYPGITSLLGQLTGDSSGNTGQIQEAIPKITKRISEMDQETKDELGRQLLTFFPELQELLNRQ
ncbi:MAG TPA: hypothetical protein GXZ85_06900 [Firmicutes bacterium]|nr:hypothetical protein [Bacillota bacterium]